MTISPWLIYFADFADNLQMFFGIICIAIGMIGIVIVFGNMIKDAELKETNWKMFKALIPWFIASLFISTFIPSSATVYKMLIIPTAINSKIVQKLPDELQQFIDKELQVKESK